MPITQSSKIKPDDLLATSGTTGQVLADAGDGTFYWVDNDSALVQTELKNFITDIKRRGFVDNTETSLTLTGAQKDTINLIDGGSKWSYYFQGEKHTITGDKSVALTGGAGNAHATGNHYIYINTADGTLKAKTAPFSIVDEVLVAIVEWNGTLPSGFRSLLSDERHTDTIDSAVHKYLHFTQGAKLISGGDLTGYTIGSGTDADKQWSVAEAVIADEDLEFTLDAQTGGGVDTYTIYYRTSASNWGWSSGNLFPYRFTVSGRMNYDDATATGAECPSISYLNVYCLLTNVVGEARHVYVTSQTTYTTLQEAYGASFNDLDLTGLSLPEKVVTHKITFEVNDATSGTGKCYIERVANYGTQSLDITPSSIGAPSLVEGSTIDDIVTFASTSGDQKDSGSKISDLQLRSEKGQANGYVALDALSNINLGSGGLKSTNVTTAIKLADVLNTSFNTSNKTIVGSINEIESELSYLSSGVFGAEPTFTDTGSGTATIGACDILLYPLSDYTGTLDKYSLSEKSLSFTDGVEEYVVADYTAGVPVIRKETNLSLINGSSIVKLFNVWRQGAIVHSFGLGSVGTGLSNKTEDNLSNICIRESYSNVFEIAETTSPNPRTITVEGGNIFIGAIKQVIDSFNSSTDKMTFVYHSSSAWIYGADTLVYNNAEYDPGTNLTSLGTGNYGVVWFYRSIGDAKHVFYILGTQSYTTEALALLSQPRTDLPALIKGHCILVGRAIILSGATSGYVQSAFSVNFVGYTPMKHDDTLSINGNGTYHISSAEATKVTALGTISSQASNNVSLTGGSISGITDLAVLDGGTGASDATNARSNLGLGSIATQASNNVSITGGSITGTSFTGSVTGSASGNQPLDSTLTSIALLGTAADKTAYTTGVDTWAETSLTSAGRALIDDTDVAAQRTTLGLVSGGTGDIWLKKAGDTATGKIVTVASDSGGAGFNFPAGAVPSSPVDGDILNSSVQNTLSAYVLGLRENFTGTIFTKTGTTTVTASVVSTAETSLAGTGIGTLTLPANFLVGGKTLRFRAYGLYTSTGAGRPTINLKFKLGSIILAQSGATTVTASATNWLWFAEGGFVVYSGATTIMGQGLWALGTSTTALSNLAMRNTTPIAITPSSSYALDITATYSANTASNSISCTNMNIEILN